MIILHLPVGRYKSEVLCLPPPLSARIANYSISTNWAQDEIDIAERLLTFQAVPLSETISLFTSRTRNYIRIVKFHLDNLQDEGGRGLEWVVGCAWWMCSIFAFLRRWVEKRGGGMKKNCSGNEFHRGFFMNTLYNISIVEFQILNDLTVWLTSVSCIQRALKTF